MNKKRMRLTPPLKSHLIGYECGITLIEMSIALVIIGLVVGGIVLGRDMILNAEVRGTMSEIDRYETQFKAFRLKYNCKPGDCAQASQFNLGLSGDGDSVLNGFCRITYANPPVARGYGECQTAWQHLSNAQMIPEVIGLLPQNSSSYEDPEGYFPRSRYGRKGYIFAHAYGGRTWIHFGLTSLPATNFYPRWAPHFKGHQLRSMMQKMGSSFTPYDGSGSWGIGAAYWDDMINHALFAAYQKIVPDGASILGKIFTPPHTTPAPYSDCTTENAILENGDCNFLVEISRD